MQHLMLKKLKKFFLKNLQKQKSSTDPENSRRARSGCWLEILIYSEFYVWSYYAKTDIFTKFIQDPFNS